MEPIQDPNYWKQRLVQSQRIGQLHQAVFRCSLERWRRIEAKHRKILARVIQDETSILDVGCGWGRLLDLMPEWWKGKYLGVDICAEFIAFARQRNPGREFRCCRIEEIEDKVDLAVLVSFRSMVLRNQGQQAWEVMDKVLLSTAKQRLYLEYDEYDEGSLE